MIYLLCLTLVISFAAVNAEGGDKVTFDQWKAAYRRSYDTPADEQKAKQIWEANSIFTKKINSGKLMWSSGLNKFSDLSPQEFSTKILMPTSEVLEFHLGHTENSADHTGDIPVSFDWRKDGKVSTVTSVKDQGFVGSCWAFSAIGNIEGQWALAGNTLIDLSPEFLVDCDGNHDDKHADCSVFGGWPYLAYDFLIGAGGVPSEADYPYCSGTGDCYPCMQGPVTLCGPPPPNCNRTITAQCPYMTPTAKITSWSAVTTDEDQIAAALYTTGPLSVLLDATQLQYYRGGIWDGHLDSVNPLLGCSKTALNHAVLLVGYGVEAAADSGEGGGEDTKYWIVKNSWGSDWGEEGYFRIKRGEGTCGINTGVTTSIVG